MKRWLGWLALCAMITLPNGASAQEPPGPLLGETGHVAVSAERLFGFSYTSQTQSMNGIDGPTTTATGFSLLSSPYALFNGPFSVPRLGIDAFVIPGLSVGGALSVFYSRQSASQAGAMGDNDVSLAGLAFDPRIGYLVRISPAIAVWPRAGLSIMYIHQSLSLAGVDMGTNSIKLVAATVEVPFAFTLVPRVVLTFGPTFDITVSGSQTQTAGPVGGTSSHNDLKETAIGAQAGLVVVL